MSTCIPKHNCKHVIAYAESVDVSACPVCERDALAAELEQARSERDENATWAQHYLQEVNALRASLAAATKERDEAKAKQPINTHKRLFDLVRFMRSELLEADLLTDNEYAWLYQHTFADDPKQGSPSLRRLEDYDDLRTQLAAAEALNGRLREALDWSLNSMSPPFDWEKFKKASALIGIRDCTTP